MQNKNAENLANKKPRKYNKALIITYRVICGVLIVICIGILFFNFLFTSSVIDGTSMQPTYNALYDDTVSEELRKKDIAYYSSHFDVDRNNIVAVNRGSTKAIKRLVAISGDTVELKLESDNLYYLYVNNIKQDESYLFSQEDNGYLYDKIINNYTTWVNSAAINVSADKITIEIPQDFCFVLGDNRKTSIDSATYGLVKNKDIIAKVVFVVPYGKNLITYWFSEIFG